MSKFCVVGKFFSYLDKKKEGLVESEDVWEEFKHCPVCVVHPVVVNGYNQRQFFYVFNIVCKKHGVEVGKVLNARCGIGRCSFEYKFIHNNVDCVVSPQKPV